MGSLSRAPGRQRSCLSSWAATRPNSTVLSGSRHHIRRGAAGEDFDDHVDHFAAAHQLDGLQRGQPVPPDPVGGQRMRLAFTFRQRGQPVLVDLVPELPYCGVWSSPGITLHS